MSGLCWTHLYGFVPPRYENISIALPAPILTCYIVLFSSSSFVCLTLEVLKLHSDHKTVTFWALQVQILLQIIINRIAILLTDRSKASRIKYSVAFIITAINISVYCIWIPARLQISDRFEVINEIWDRCEKVIYLGIDAALNVYFIHSVQKRLVEAGLSKYDSLVKFNKYIIGLSLSMDVLIISMMSLKNTFV